MTSWSTVSLLIFTICVASDAARIRRHSTRPIQAVTGSRLDEGEPRDDSTSETSEKAQAAADKAQAKAQAAAAAYLHRHTAHAKAQAQDKAQALVPPESSTTAPTTAPATTAAPAEVTTTASTDVLTTCHGPDSGACKFPFEWQGKKYSACTSVDHDQPWCYQEDGGWDNCNCETSTSTSLVPMDPKEYWEADNALQRCRSTTSLRTTKIFIGAAVVVVAGGLAVLEVVHTSWLNVALNAASGLISTGGKSSKVKSELKDAAGASLYTYTMIEHVEQHVGAIIKLFLTTCVQVFGTGGYLIVVPSVAYLKLSPVIGVMGNAEKLTQSGVESALGVDAGMRLLGYGENFPSCCCKAAEGEVISSAMCALVSTSAEANWQQCPTGWIHDATQCAVPEIVQYSDEQTVGACQCKNYTTCSTNAPWQGHAWCDVVDNRTDGSQCGWSYTPIDGKPQLWDYWDYCRIDGKPLQYAEGLSSAPNDALSTFIPNSFEHSSVLPGQDNVFTIGSYVDASRGLVMAKKSIFNTSSCFAGHPVETLSACAKLCLKEGAPTAKTLSTDGDSQHKCVAFAWHRQLHLCVRLPEFAEDDAEFTPHMTEWTGDGWQNFVSKYRGDEADAACSASVLLNIWESGYNIIRDKNNGHLYVQCADTEETKSRTQKVSCLPSECDHKSSWCFVRNSCRSGMPYMLGGCGRFDEATCEITGARKVAPENRILGKTPSVE